MLYTPFIDPSNLPSSNHPTLQHLRKIKLFNETIPPLASKKKKKKESSKYPPTNDYRIELVSLKILKNFNFIFALNRSLEEEEEEGTTRVRS